MNEARQQLIEHEVQRYKKTLPEVKTNLANSEVQVALKTAIEHCSLEIQKWYLDNPQTNFTFVVGGKSRRLTELLLNHVVKKLPADHPAITAIQHRLRLNEEQNKALYAEEEKADLSPIMGLGTAQTEYIICDDAMLTGRKAFHTLNNATKAQIPVRYLLFSGPAKFLHDEDYLRPDNWPELEAHLTIGTTHEKAAETLKKLSKLLSVYTNMRLYRTIKIGSQQISTSSNSMDKVDRELSLTLSETAELITALEKALE